MQEAAENAAQTVANAAPAARENARGALAVDLFALALFSICSNIWFKNIPGIRMIIPDREGC